MEKGLLKEELLDEFLESLRRFGELHAPQVTVQGVTAFAPLRDLSALHLDYRRTLIPPKKYLLPFREEILNYRDGSYDSPLHDVPEVVVFGLHPCDLQGISYLDMVFLGEDPDPCYSRRRSALTLIGISCEPDDFCFCSSSIHGSACDLFLHTTEGGFEVEALTSKGEEIVRGAAKLLLSGDGMSAVHEESCPIPPQDPQLRFSDHPLWEDFARRCVSCGACSLCCPTCYCFDVREYPGLTGGGMRVREWDNCLFKSHGEVAGANFRPTRLDRLRYRFLHKYCGFSPLQGMTSCVGCGRCRKVCPVDIDLRELLDLGDSGMTSP